MGADADLGQRAARYRRFLEEELAPLGLTGADLERAVMWCTISELFLDTRHDDKWLQVFAAVLADSPYSAAELQRIYADEVAPVLWPNLVSPAGEWAVFPPSWLAREVARHRTSWLSRSPLLNAALRPLKTALTNGDWRGLLARAEAIRMTSGRRPIRVGEAGGDGHSDE